jgi:hypothetical protein
MKMKKASDRGHPVARLEPLNGDDEGEHSGRLLRLVRDGLVRLHRTAPPRALFGSRPPSTETGASAVAALIEERREAR